jgi:hypothetical protein
MGDKSPNPAELAEGCVDVRKGFTTRYPAHKRKRTSSVTTRSDDEEIKASEPNIFENADAHSSGSTTLRPKAEGKERAENMPTPGLEPDNISSKGPSIQSATSCPSERGREPILPDPRHFGANVAMDADVTQQNKTPTPDLSDTLKSIVPPDPREVELDVDMDPNKAQTNELTTTRAGAQEKGKENAEVPDVAIDANDPQSSGSATSRATAKGKEKEKAEVPTAKASRSAGDIYIHEGNYEAIPADAPPCLFKCQLAVVG